MRPLVLAIALLLSCASVAVASPAGDVNLLKHADAGFDGQLAAASSSPARKDRIRGEYSRMRAYAPYFNRNLGWYPNAWAYQDMYAVYRDRRENGSRLKYVLRDRSGRRLFIPWGCNGTCPQYAADVGNPGWRARWISDARKKLAAGYRGLWIDDVTLQIRTSDASGRWVKPVDPRTGRTMTSRAWKRYTVEFLEQVRRAFPNVEIVHNALWWVAPLGSSAMRRQVAATDWFSVEHAFTDSGLTGGRGHASLRTFMKTVDRLHRRGKHMVLEANEGGARARTMLLAGYLMVSDGGDLVASNRGTSPGRIWKGFRLNLGEAKGKRRRWHGVWRRDFQGGTALVSDPGSRKRRLRISGRSLSGKAIHAVKLRGRSGAIVLR